MSHVLDQVAAHAMALHYLAQSEEKLRQRKLSPERHRAAVEALAALRQAHREGDAKAVVDLANRLLAIDPESLEARWYRRNAEARQRPGTTGAATRNRPASAPRPRSALSGPTPELRPTLVVAGGPAGPSSSGSRSVPLWGLAAAGLLLLALVGMLWGLAGTPAPPPRAAADGEGASLVRPSPFDEPEELVFDVRPAAPLPAVTSIVPLDVPAGAETAIAVFGKSFEPSARLLLVDPPAGVVLLEPTVVGAELIEARLAVPEGLEPGTRLVFRVENPGGRRSAERAVTVASR